MNSFPIQEFQNDKELNDCLKEWQERLFLGDWIIKACLVDANELPENAGYNNWIFEKQTSFIQIARLTDDTKARMTKVFQEVTLVHELLHLKFGLVENVDSYEGKFVEIHEHQLVEQMAKSLIMAKYGLNPSWFINFEVK